MKVTLNLNVLDIQPFLHYCSSNLINILHCQWNQTGTATGRISSSNPNMQVRNQSYCFPFNFSNLVLSRIYRKSQSAYIVQASMLET